MTFDELKDHGGYVTLNGKGCVVRYVNHLIPTGPLERGQWRVLAELVFTAPDDSKSDEEEADGNMETALKAGIKYAARGFRSRVWVDVDCADVDQIKIRLQNGIDEIGGDASADLPHCDVNQFPSWRRLPAPRSRWRHAPKRRSRREDLRALRGAFGVHRRVSDEADTNTSGLLAADTRWRSQCLTILLRQKPSIRQDRRPVGSGWSNVFPSTLQLRSPCMSKQKIFRTGLRCEPYVRP